VKFSIVTPSYRNSEWLKLCIASVSDQEGVEHEHIVQDACSDDGTEQWLPHDSRVRAYIEKDSGMYDAVNRGIRRSNGELVAYLNCDEQYLPGALKKVHDCFEAHPAVDIVISHFVVVDGQGEYICHRYAMPPRWAQAWDRFSISTCALFFRRNLFTERGMWFDTHWRDVADTSWVLSACQQKLTWQVMREFTSAFADTGENMNLKPNALREKAELLRMRPTWVKLLAPFIRTQYRMEFLRSGVFQQGPFDYSIYTRTSPDSRKAIHVPSPTAMWKGRALLARSHKATGSGTNAG
jgi:glycosyltransferase involved in cell wall biosynthesis